MRTKTGDFIEGSRHKIGDLVVRINKRLEMLQLGMRSGAKIKDPGTEFAAISGSFTIFFISLK